MKMWSGRFQSGPDPHFEQWQRSFPFDRRLLPQEIAASSAYARALRKADVLTSAEEKQVLAGLQAIVDDVRGRPALLDDPNPEDVHHFVEMQLVQRIGDLGYKLHSGRSRNEQIATDLRLYVLEQASVVKNSLADLCDVFIQRAEAAGQNAMPAYTHLQRAEPVLVAHWLLAYVEMFLRGAQRIDDCKSRTMECCPLGSGAIAGSTIQLDRELLARELGFQYASVNSVDATSDRDFVIEFVQTLSLIAIHLSRLAEELIIFSTQEFGFIRLPETYSTGSSAMPQKKNPDSLELIRAKAARVLGSVVAISTNMKGLPLAYNKDLQDSQESLFAASDAVVDSLPIAIGFMRDVEFDFGRMQQAATGTFMNAFAAATYLVGKGVPFRLAHEQIGKAVRLCLEKGCALEDLPLHEFREFSPAVDNDIYTALTLDSVLNVHDVIGGTAPGRVKSATSDAKARVSSLRKGVVFANTQG